MRRGRITNKMIGKICTNGSALDKRVLIIELKARREDVFDRYNNPEKAYENPNYQRLTGLIDHVTDYL